MKWKGRLAVAAGALLGLAGLALVAVRWLVWMPPSEMEVVPTCSADAPAVPRGRPLKVLVWNAQFAAGRSQTFFYDGGRAVSVPPSEVTSTLRGLRAAVEAVQPDFVLWQELDRDSRRTGRVDELADLARGWPCLASTPYYKVRHVPSPSWEHLGRVDLKAITAQALHMGDEVHNRNRAATSLFYRTIAPAVI